MGFGRLPVIIIVLTVLFLILMLSIYIVENKYKALSAVETNSESNLQKQNGDKFFGLSILLLCVVITVRAFIGSAVHFTWAAGTGYLLILAAFITAGKAAGGILADKFGSIFIGTTALLLSAPLLAFLSGNMVISFLGICLFNMTMPLTMTAIFHKMPDYPAFSFGIAAMALIPGFYAGGVLPVNKVILLLIIIVTAILLYQALSLTKRVEGGVMSE